MESVAETANFVRSNGDTESGNASRRGGKYDLWLEEGFFCPGRAARAAPGRFGQEGCCGASKKHFIFAAEKMKNSLLTL